jgi:hypothetical protein
MKVGVDQDTLVTPIPAFPPQRGRRLGVWDPVEKVTSPKRKGFVPSPKDRECPGFKCWYYEVGGDEV